MPSNVVNLTLVIVLCFHMVVCVHSATSSNEPQLPIGRHLATTSSIINESSVPGDSFPRLRPSSADYPIGAQFLVLIVSKTANYKKFFVLDMLDSGIDGTAPTKFDIAYDLPPGHAFELMMFRSTEYLMTGKQILEFHNFTLEDMNASTTVKRQRDGQAGLSESAKGCSTIGPSTFVPSDRRIEFIGDSITCGYCNVCHRDPGLNAWDQNFGFSWATVTCEAFGADCHTESGSGRGMAMNGDGTLLTMPTLFNRTLANVATSAWNWTAWQYPQVVVINLGTNDFNKPLNNRGNKTFEQLYIDTYVRFVIQLYDTYGSGVHLFLACGPMTSYYCPFLNTITRLAQAQRNGINIHLLFQDLLPSLRDCCSHPTATGDYTMAQATVDAIYEVMGWEVVSSVDDIVRKKETGVVRPALPSRRAR